MTKFNVISREVENGTFPAHSDKEFCCSAFGKDWNDDHQYVFLQKNAEQNRQRKH